MENIKPYRKYKPSGISWLGDIPEHWQVSKAKHILYQKKKTLNPDLNCGSISFGKIVYKDNERVPLETKATYQELLKGEFLINPLNLNFDLKSLRTGLSTIDVVVSTGYIVLQKNSNFNSNYLKWLLHQFDISFMKTLGDGVRQTLSYTDFKNTDLPYISNEEQTSIANFLDYKTAKIDLFIRKKKQLIKLLNEQKAGIITHAVTKGLDANAKMKPSGIEWLGNVPEHWVDFKLKSIGYLYGGLSGKSGEDFKIENETKISPYIPFTNIANNNVIDIEKLAFVKVSEGEKQNIAKKGDLLFLMSSENFEDIGKTSLLNNDINNLYLNSFCKGFRIIDKNILPEFLNYLLSADIHRKRLSIQARGFTRINLKIGKVNDLLLFSPKTTSEQQAIVSHIEKETSKLNRAITTIEKEIKLVQEYRTALIAEAVTGKTDVREYKVPVLEEENLVFEEVEEEMDLVAEDGEGMEVE